MADSRESRRQFLQLKVGPGQVEIAHGGDGIPPRPPVRAPFALARVLELVQEPGQRRIQAYGQTLFQRLLMDDPRQRVSAEYRRSFDSADVVVQLRLQLLNDAGPEVLQPAWEYLCDADGLYLALNSERFRFVRQLGSLPVLDLPPVDGPPRVLVVLANPQNLYQFSVTLPGPDGPTAHHFVPIESPLRPEQTNGLLRLFDGLAEQGSIAGYRLLSGPPGPGQPEHPALLAAWPTLDAVHNLLQTAEAAGQPYHIVHFLGHGYVAGDEGYLLLTDEEGGAAPVSQRTFASLFPAEHQVRLVLLAACQSGSGEQRVNQPLVGLAPALLQQGVPAVIAMQDVISIRGAAAFTEAFYAELTRHGYVDTAVVEARREIQRRQPEQGEWFIPVLYLQADEARLFIPETAVPPPPLVRPDFAINRPVPFVDRDQELDRLQRVLCEDALGGPRIVRLHGPALSGKYSLLEMVRYRAYQAGCAHLLLAVVLPSPVQAVNSLLHQRLNTMLEPLRDYPEALAFFKTLRELRAADFPAVQIINLFLDGLEQLSGWLDRKLLCIFYFEDFEQHRRFIISDQGLGQLLYEVAQRYHAGQLARVRFLFASDQPFVPRILDNYFFPLELKGFPGIEYVHELCQEFGLVRDGRVPRQVFDFVRAYTVGGHYLPGPVVRLLDQMRATLVLEGESYLDTLEWVLPSVGGGA